MFYIKERFLDALFRILPVRDESRVETIDAENLKSAVFTVVNDGFVEYLAVLLQSILQFNSWFDLPVVVLHSQTLSPLSDANRRRLEKVYSNISFREVDENRYEAFLDHTPKHMLPALYSLESFRSSEYDRVVFLDCDMLCLGDISDLFRKNVDLGAVPPGKDRTMKEEVAGTFRRGIGLNTGVLSVGKKYLSDSVYEALFRRRSGEVADQNIINSYFLFRELYCYHHKYNYHAEFFWNDEARDADVRLLHYAGDKPLDQPSEGRMKIWFEWRERFNTISAEL